MTVFAAHVNSTDAEAGSMDHITLSRYKPESLDSLCRNTKFTKREIQIMYRGFKQVVSLIGVYLHLY